MASDPHHWPYAGADRLMPYDWEDRIAESGGDFLGYANRPKLDKQIRNAFFKAEEVISSHDLVIYGQFFFVGKQLAG